MTIHRWLAEWSSWGWPLFANHLWQATVISLIALAAAWLLRNGPGRVRYAVWLIASATFILPSTLAVQLAHALGIDFSFLLALNEGPSDGATVFFQLTAPILQINDYRGAANSAARHNELFCALTVVWLTGSVVLLAMWFRRRLRFRRVLRATALADPSRELLALERVRSWMGIKRDVRLSILPGTVEPGVWGVWRPRVFLPQSMANELDDAELEAVIMHEMIHIARWDNLIANLHRVLCCVIWFHPFIWFLDRSLLAERERACDDEVIRLGGKADVYASSLLKVLRFCLGWNVAGASNATGSNLGRRIERIMSTTVQVKLSVWHRVAIGSTAALVVILSIGAGLLTSEGVVAQSAKPRQNASSDIPGGVPGGVPGGLPGGVGDDQDMWIERLDQAREITVEFRNSTKAPVAISEAKVKAVPREDGPGDEFALSAVITFTNKSDRRIRGVVIELRNAAQRIDYYERASSPIEPQATYTSRSRRPPVFLVGRPENVSVRVSGVVFDDGEVWGAAPPPPPPPPPPPEELRMLEAAPETSARFNNSNGAALTITGATLRTARVERAQRVGTQASSQERYMIKLNVQLSNNSGRRISGLAFEFAHPDSKDGIRTFTSVKIEPFATYNLELPPPDAPGYGAFLLPGNPSDNEARVIGIKFEDGEIWGVFPPPPPPPPAPPVVSPAEGPKLIRKSREVFAASATRRIVPDSPPLARAARISGSVVVEVTLDEAGVVIEARAISGHPLLKDAAVNAARQWQFTPTLLSGVPVRVIGTLAFNFEP